MHADKAHKLAVLNVVALTDDLIDDSTPNLKAFRDAGTRRYITPPIPAVTTTSQTTMLTGTNPRSHGIVANGWYFRDTSEIRFWHQSNHLVQAPCLWDNARERDPSLTCAQMFWWYNMYSSADYSVTPRPIYKADNRKIPDVYASPPELRGSLQAELGRFPLFNFWGPMSSIASSEWIAKATMRVAKQHDPTLTLAYLPHLDYALQKHGPASPEARAAAREIDSVVGDLIGFFLKRDTRVAVLSEYGITPVSDAVPINRVLRQAGLVAVRGEMGLDMLDPGASRAFAVADHQVAHVYVRDPADLEIVRELCESTPGVDLVLDPTAQRDLELFHDRSGDFLLVSDTDKWFTYDFWLEDAQAPDFARTVDIHRKPGYDPRELFVDPAFRLPRLAVGHRLIRKKLGFRTLLDVIPLDTSLVRGSHGRADLPASQGPLLITESGAGDGETIEAAEVHGLLLDALFASRP